ncbi:MAG: magnesium/cobalt transporter CorA [Nitrospirales bacterium]
MTLQRRKRSSKSGLPPGTPVHIGDQKLSTMSITSRMFSETSTDIALVEPVGNIAKVVQDPRNKWVTIHGIHDVAGLQTVAEVFGLHPLVVEDIVNTEQRPKIEDYGSYMFLIMKMVSDKGIGHPLGTEQVSLVLGKNFVLCFLEGSDNPFAALEERLTKEQSRLRHLGCDYLAYAHIDTLIDHYFPLLERLGEEIDALEEELVERPGQEGLKRLHYLKRRMLYVRKTVWPLREVLSHLERGDSGLIQTSTHMYIRDAYDHVVQIIETTETYREMLGEFMDLYLSSLSNRLNETMKVLTVIATIFIPLTFIVGIYGMNFRVMPELEWPWGYPVVMGVMLCLALGMLWYFRKKRWV